MLDNRSDIEDNDKVLCNEANGKVNEVGRCTSIGHKYDTGAINKELSDGIKDLIRASFRQLNNEMKF